MSVVGKLFGRLLAAVATGLLTGGIAVALLGALWVGRGYYRVPRDLRPEHELHGLLGAGGSLGVALGLLGTGLMVAMLLYTLRKALPRARILGPTSAWLQLHIVCGVGGPLAIVLHAGFVWPRGLVAVAFWCMVAVALSGAFGRYVYALVPRATGGRALQWDDALARLADLRAEIVAETAQLDPAALGRAVESVQDFDHAVRGPLDLLALQRDLRRRRRILDRHLDAAGLDGTLRARTRAALLEQLRLKRGLEASRVAGRLLRYWHLFHRPLAGAMYAIVALHVATAVLFGGSLSQLSRLWE